MSQTSYEMLYERWNGSVAECDALRAENERLNVLLMNTRGERADLRAEVERLGNQWKAINAAYDAVYDERDTLREEVDRLREAFTVSCPRCGNVHGDRRDPAMPIEALEDTR